MTYALNQNTPVCHSERACLSGRQVHPGPRPARLSSRLGGNPFTFRGLRDPSAHSDALIRPGMTVSAEVLII